MTPRDAKAWYLRAARRVFLGGEKTCTFLLIASAIYVLAQVVTAIALGRIPVGR